MSRWSHAVTVSPSMYPYRREATPPAPYQYPLRAKSSTTDRSQYPGGLQPINSDWLKTPSPQKPPQRRKRRRIGTSQGTSLTGSKKAQHKEAEGDNLQQEWLGSSSLEASDQVHDNSVYESLIDTGFDNAPILNSTLEEEEDGYLHSAELDEHVAQQADGEKSFEAYVEMVTSGCAKFIQITKIVYAVQGWNRREQELSDDFYHLEARNVGNRLRLVCLCPDAKKECLCVHQLFYLEFREDMFEEKEKLWSSEKKVIMFWRQRTGFENLVWLTRFSVANHMGGLNGRAIVSYEGPDAGGGTWRCSKDKGRCEHIDAARRVLRETLNIADDDEVDEGIESQDTGSYRVVEDLSGGRDRETAISFLPIMPPKWAFLATDPVLYTRANPTAYIPQIITMQVGKARACCANRPEMDPLRPKIVRPCKVYTYTTCLERSIEVQQCPECPPRRHCFIGPDPRHLGLFNYNNSVLFSHELLDEYTNRSGTSETPFAAFTQCSARVFNGRGSKFIGEDLFREAWFAYAALMLLTDDMMCPKCGREPENVIFDGVTLSFHKKHVTGTLHPPTYIEDDAPIRHRNYPRKPQWLPAMRNETPARERLREFLKAQRSAKPCENQKEGTGTLGQDQVGTRNYVAEIVAEVGKVSPEVARLTERIFGHGDSEWRAVLGGLRRKYMKLLEQLAAEESAMQMVNESALEKLRDFIASPTEENGSTLVDVPALLAILEGEMRLVGSYTPELLQVCQWMVRRATEVLTELKAGNLPPLPALQQPKEQDWDLLRPSKNPK
ncbi:hypothetical protein VNI00_008777 [Paramarasmius palmivorus]|uniref:HMG domain-containing protein n=1 Tax=Paramarasmius palmivorus TaxID=297713 RepID=A0AAW0CWS9_9AGAR